MNNRKYNLDDVSFVEVDDVPNLRRSIGDVFRQCPAGKAIKFPLGAPTGGKALGQMVGTANRYSNNPFRPHIVDGQLFLIPKNTEQPTPEKETKTAKKKTSKRKYTRQNIPSVESTLELPIVKKFTDRPNTESLERVIELVKEHSGVHIPKSAFPTARLLHDFVYSFRERGLEVLGTKAESTKITVLGKKTSEAAVPAVTSLRTADAQTEPTSSVELEPA